MGTVNASGGEPGIEPRARQLKPRDEDLDFFGITHRGHVRSENQDHFLVTTLHKTMRVHVTSLPNPELLEMPSQRLASLALVCDGVGGHAGGEAASRAAVEAIAGYVTHTMECFFSSPAGGGDALLGTLRQAAQATHEHIAARARQSGDLQGMATTLTLVLAVWPDLYLLHVGDSRCYRLREGALVQLTQDQTFAQELLDSGLLSPEQARRSPYSSVLASSLGGAVSKPEVLRTDLRHGDVLLMCTDGLTRHVSDDRLRARLATLTTSEQAARDLLQDALDAGGIDNVTVLVLRSTVKAGS